MDWQALIDLDKQLLLWFNGSQSLFLDSLVRTLTHAFTWIPCYVSLFYIVLRNNDNVARILYILAGAAVCVLMAGMVDDAIVKPTVARWRPTHDPQIGMLVDIVDGYRGGKYGFFSAHAANTFSVAVFFWWLVRSRLLTFWMVVWSLTNCWTRLYLGVHFPGDILVGLCWGTVCGSFAYWLYYRLTRSMKSMAFTSAYYTKTGYQRQQVDIYIVVFILTVLYALIRATFSLQ